MVLSNIIGEGKTRSASLPLDQAGWWVDRYVSGCVGVGSSVEPLWGSTGIFRYISTCALARLRDAGRARPFWFDYPPSAEASVDVEEQNGPALSVCCFALLESLAAHQLPVRLSARQPTSVCCEPCLRARQLTSCLS